MLYLLSGDANVTVSLSNFSNNLGNIVRHSWAQDQRPIPWISDPWDSDSLCALLEASLMQSGLGFLPFNLPR